jgi:hypothetical protein
VQIVAGEDREDRLAEVKDMVGDQDVLVAVNIEVGAARVPGLAVPVLVLGDIRLTCPHRWACHRAEGTRPAVAGEEVAAASRHAFHHSYPELASL